MTGDWQESQRHEEVLQIEVTRANRAPENTKDPEAVGSALEASPDREHISQRLPDLIEECLPDRAGSDADRGLRAHSALKLGNPLQRLCSSSNVPGLPTGLCWPQSRGSGTGLTLQLGPRLSHNEAPFPNLRSARWRKRISGAPKTGHDCLGVFRGQ